MSRQLYPKPPVTRKQKAAIKKKEDNPFDHKYHVYYDNPGSNDIEGEWKHYDSETAVKLDAWYRCRVLDFSTRATLFDQQEFQDGAMQGGIADASQ